MKKLKKNVELKSNTIEAFGCVCGCTCECSCYGSADFMQNDYSDDHLTPSYNTSKVNVYVSNS